MGLKKLLIKNKNAIAEKWIASVLQGNAQSVIEIESHRRFANPQADRITQELEAQFENLIQENENCAGRFLCENLLRIKALSEEAPAEAVAFPFALRTIIRDQIAAELENNSLRAEFVQFEEKIERFALQVFQKYTENREKIFQLKLKEIKNGMLSGNANGTACPSSLLTKWEIEEKKKVRKMG